MLSLLLLLLLLLLYRFYLLTVIIIIIATFIVIIITIIIFLCYNIVYITIIIIVLLFNYLLLLLLHYYYYYYCYFSFYFSFCLISIVSKKKGFNFIVMLSYGAKRRSPGKENKGEATGPWKAKSSWAQFFSHLAVKSSDVFQSLIAFKFWWFTFNCSFDIFLDSPPK